MFVKICGIRDAAALAAAVRAGADAVGFVFADSPRQVSAAVARDLCESLPTHVARVAVMRHPDAARVAAVLQTFGPDCLQTDAEDFATIDLPAGCAALPVYRNGRVPPDALPPRLLFEGVTSGHGETADWDEAQRLATATELVLAGGLDAGNVADAIGGVRPWGVDVSSGVESGRGIKDPARIEEFVARVRAVETA